MTDTMPGSRSITAEMLLAHQPWMRALARRLVLDEHEADDLVQDAWLAALEKPPEKSGSLGAWLGSVIRNGAKQLARGESRRGQRERRASKPEAIEATSDVVARAEAQGIVVQAVLGLSEPARTTVLLRFFDGLPPRKIAKQMGCPVETVRARIRRALQKMRADLDAEHGGRRAWALALIPLARLEPPPTPAGTTGGALGAAAGVVLVAGLGAAGGYGAMGALESEPEPTSAAVVEQPDNSVERARLERALRQANQRNDELRRELTDLPSPETTPPVVDASTTEDATAAAPKLEPLFAFGRHRDAFVEEDWRAIGEAVRGLYRLNGPIVDAVAAGVAPDPALVGRSQTENAPLVVAALRWSEAGVTGTNVNSAFTHPVALANVFGATMDVAEVPLTTAQRTALERLAAEYGERESARDARARADGHPTLRRLLDESRLRQAFVRSVRELLTPKQRSVLGHARHHDRTGTDIVTAAIIWTGVVLPLDGRTRDGTVNEIAGRLHEELGDLTPAARDAVTAAVRTWNDGMPEDERAVPVDSLGREGLLHIDTIHTWAKRALALLDALRALDGLTDEQLRALDGWSRPFVPIRPAEDAK